MTIHLPDDLIHSIRAEVQSGRYPSEDALVAAAIRNHLGLQADQPVAAPNQPDGDPVQYKSIWEEIAELHKSVPDEAWANLPVDGSAQIDHYVYGSPKRSDP